jgi:ABC-2 type transport system permease protein
MIAFRMKRGKIVSSFSLFLRRFRDCFLFQYKVIKSIADWTIMLYLIVPSVIIGSMIYRSWWHGIPYWAAQMPFEIFFLIPFVYILAGYFRTYLLGADQIFLLKDQRLFLGLKKWGVISTYSMTLLMTACIGLLLAPFWLNHYKAGTSEFLVYLLFLLSSKWSHIAVKGVLAGFQKSWKRPLLFLLAIVLQLQLWGAAYQLIDSAQYVLLAAAGILLIGISIVMNRRRIYSKKSMQRDLRIEGMLKVKWIAMIFMFSYQVEKEPVASERSKPRLFRKSQTLFKKRTPFFGYLELYSKVLIRNITYSATYFQSIGTLSFSQVVLPPLWLKLGAAGLVALSILAWNEWVWHKLFANHPIGSKYSDETDRLKAQRATRTLAFIPFFIVLAFSVLSYYGVF